jgi:2,4'-dihydroxyacetophenone dioxygenase
MSETDVRQRDATAAPYLGRQPDDMRPDLVVSDLWPDDDRFWVPIDDGTWSRPLHFDVTHGQYTHLMRVTRQGIIARHRHTGPVFAHVLRGRWHYLEHDWVAEEGGFVFEPPGETHTLVVPEGCGEMATLFQVNGALVYVAQDGTALGYDDVFTRLENARRHFQAVGLDAGELERMIR